MNFVANLELILTHIPAHKRTCNSSQNVFKFPTTWRCTSDLIRMLLKSKMVSWSTSYFLWVQKLAVRNYLNLTITFLTTWRCASDFLPKFKTATMYWLHNFWWAQELNLMMGDAVYVFGFVLCSN